MSSTETAQFSDDALHLIEEARNESVRLRHEYIGAEHVVLAMSRSADTLGRFGVDAGDVSQLIEQTITRGSDAVPADVPRPFTWRTKKAFAFAEESAQTFGRDRVQVGDILRGLLAEQMNIGAKVLADRGLTLDAVDEILRQDTGGNA